MAKKVIEILEEGAGQVFSKITPNEFREHMREKVKNAWRDKRTDIKTAIGQFLHDGDYLTMGGVSFIRLSMASVHEIIRQKKKNLNLAAGTRTYDFNLLLDAGCVKNIDCGYITGMEIFGIPYVTRKRAERMITSGEMGISEYDNASMAFRHKAAAMGIPFLPIRNMMGADGFKHSAAKKIRCPFTGEELVLVPAIYADVCIIHVHRCDIYGNSQIEGALNEDLGKSKSAKRLIITTEKIIDTEKIRLSPDRTLIPCFYVDAVVEIPYGAHPTNMPGMYYVDINHMKEYISAARDQAGLDKYYNKHIFGVEHFKEYLKTIGGKKKLKYLEDLEHLKQDD
jgi:acyl CoA:acetate/3-ketoacid CoA transferase alpha subunit